MADENDMTDENEDDKMPDDLERDSAESHSADSDVASIKAERDKYLELARRTQAEFENYQKRVRRDWEADRRFAALPVVADLLPVLDNLERAMQSAKGEEATGPLHQGIELVHKQWLGVLAKHGVTPMDPVGSPFDPNQHEALMQQPTEEYDPMTVIAVTRTGYTLHDRIIRPAQVIVAAAPK